MLRPETQDLEAFVDGVWNITEAQERVARQYFDDESIEDACPPLRALLTIMARGSYEGKDAHHPEVRALFTREALLESPWYRERLAARQRRELALWERHLRSLEQHLAELDPQLAENLEELERRRDVARTQLALIGGPAYLEALRGTLGLDPSLIRPS